MTVSELAKKLTTTIKMDEMIVRKGMKEDTRVNVYHVRSNKTVCIVVVNTIKYFIDDKHVGSNTVDYYYIDENGNLNIFYK